LKEDKKMKKYFDPSIRIKEFDREAILTVSGETELTNKQEAENFLKAKVSEPSTIDILIL